MDDGREQSQHVEARKAQALLRIRQRINESVSSDHRRSDPRMRFAGLSSADFAVVIRSFLEEMQRDPEVADALKVDLATSLSETARVRIRRAPLDQELDDESPLAPRPPQVARLPHGEQSDVLSILRTAEDTIRAQQLSFLRNAVVLSVASPGRLSGQASVVVRLSVDIADSIGSLLEAIHEFTESAMKSQGGANKIPGYLEAKSIENLREAVHDLSFRTEELHAQVQRIAKEHLAGDRHSVFCDEPTSGIFDNLGHMFILSPRTPYSAFNPSLQEAFRATGNSLTTSLLDTWLSNEDRQDTMTVQGQ